MRISKVRVQNYKCIIDTGWIDINRVSTTFIGRNESGKTSIMEAIAFFSDVDNCPNEKITARKDSFEQESPDIISIEIRIDGNDSDSYHQIAADSTGDDDRVVFTKRADGRRRIDDINISSTNWNRAKYTREANSRLSDLHDEQVKKISDSGQYDEIYPDISDLYPCQLQLMSERIRQSMNDFANEFSTDSDTDPDVIEKTHDELQDIRSMINSARRETTDPFEALPDIIYYDELELVDDTIDVDSVREGDGVLKKLLENNDISYSLDSPQDPADINRQLRSLSRETSRLVSDYWRQKSVEVAIDLNIGDEFQVLVRDTSIYQTDNGLDDGDGENMQVFGEDMAPSQRSRGFQWFLSFCLNMIADEECLNSEKLILLDDPAVFLHPEGKKDCLNAMNRLSGDSQIVYSTHSPFLIEKGYPERLRVVEDMGDEEGTNVTTDFTEAGGLALEPVRKALGIGLGDLPFVSGRMILLEGITDYLILTGIGHYYRDHVDRDVLDIDEVSLIPSEGGNQIVTAGKWVASENLEYALLLDNDSKGREVKDEIRTHHTDIDPTRTILLEEQQGRHSGEFEIEDMFDPEFYVECVNEVYSQAVEQFDDIGVENDHGEILINGEEYEGADIVSLIEQSLREQGIESELRKRATAEKIKYRLDNNHEITEQSVESFLPLLGQLNAITELRD
jgi:predicted ATP-dependent endonuclease of OLD family